MNTWRFDKHAMGGRAGKRFAVVLGVSLVLAIGMALAACGDDDDDGGDGGGGSQAEEFKIAFFTDAQDNSYLQAAVAAAKEHAAERGVEMDVIDAGWDANKQLGQVQDAVSSGQYDALVVESVDGEVLCDDLTAAAEEMVVSIYNAPICGDYDDLYTEGTIGFFGPDNYQLGQLMGKEIAEALDGSGQVGYVSGPVQVGIVAATTDGVKDALGKYPAIELVAELDGAWDAAKGLAATQDLVNSHPDVDGLIYGVDQMAVPSIDWLKKSGNLGDIKIVTLGGSKEGFQLIEDGVIHSSVNSLPREEALYGLQAAIDTLEGKKIDVPGWDAKRKVYNTVEDPNIPGVVDASNVASTPAEWGL
jgi:ribose transport system substrate-binding protein